jgi:hypothetical protein
MLEIVEIIKIARRLADSRDKDFCGFEAGFSSSDGRQFKIEMKRTNPKVK